MRHIYISRGKPHGFINTKQSLIVIGLTGYKSICELGLELKPLNIFIGANGAGKSNFLSVFTLLRNIVNRKLEWYVTQQGGADYVRSAVILMSG